MADEKKDGVNLQLVDEKTDGVNNQLADEKTDGVNLQLIDRDPEQRNGEAGGSNKTLQNDGGDYDPHSHRQVDRPTNNFETLVHLLKCSLGTGILAMPQSFTNAGLYVGSIGTVLLGILVTYSLHVLIRSQYALCKRERVPLLSYPQSMKVGLSQGPKKLRCMAKVAPPLVDWFLVVYQLGICCVYIVFIGDSLKTIVDPYYPMSVQIHMLIILGPLICFNLIRNLKLLAPFSTVANIITFIGLGVVIYYLLAMPSEKVPIDNWGSLTTFPLFFGTVLFALTAVGVVVALENNMKSPKSFGKPCGVLNVGMTIITGMYVLIGILGYLQCRSNCKDSITLALPKNDPLATSVTALFAIAVFISYGLQCYVPVEILWRSYLLPRLQAKGSQRLLMWEYLLRIGLCLLTFVLAVSVPHLGLFISLFGALCLSVLGICFPAILDMCILYPSNYGKWRWRAVRGVFLTIVGALGLIFGTYSALAAIIKKL